MGAALMQSILHEGRQPPLVEAFLDEAGIATPLARPSPGLVHRLSFRAGIVAVRAGIRGTLSPRSYHCVPPHPATCRTMGPLRWPLCKNALGA